MVCDSWNGQSSLLFQIFTTGTEILDLSCGTEESPPTHSPYPADWGLVVSAGEVSKRSVLSGEWCQKEMSYFGTGGSLQSTCRVLSNGCSKSMSASVRCKPRPLSYRWGQRGKPTHTHRHLEAAQTWAQGAPAWHPTAPPMARDQGVPFLKPHLNDSFSFLFKIKLTFFSSHT